MRHKGRCAFVTGGARRIGAAIAEALATEGADVALHYRRSHEEAHALCDEFRRRFSGNYCAVRADLSCADDVTRAFGEADRKLGGVDVAICNASHFVRDDADAPNEETFVQSMRVNAFAPALLARLLAERNPGERSDVVMVSDYVSDIYSDAFFSYGASRAAGKYVVTALALRYAPHMRVNAIALGNAWPAPTQRQEHFDALCERSPLRMATPICDVTNAVCFLLESASVTGHTLFLDAGNRLARPPYVPSV
ncbi:MAG: SDR family oxidoreductase [Rickettsiales bacterium]